MKKYTIDGQEVEAIKWDGLQDTFEIIEKAAKENCYWTLDRLLVGRYKFPVPMNWYFIVYPNGDRQTYDEDHFKKLFQTVL